MNIQSSYGVSNYLGMNKISALRNTGNSGNASLVPVQSGPSRTDARIRPAIDSGMISRSACISAPPRPARSGLYSPPIHLRDRCR